MWWRTPFRWSLRASWNPLGPGSRPWSRGVTKLGGIHFTNHTEAQAENLRRNVPGDGQRHPRRAGEAGRTGSTMRTLARSRENEQRIAREPREIYCPLRQPTGHRSSVGTAKDWLSRCLEPESVPGDSRRRWQAAKATGRPLAVNELRLLKIGEQPGVGGHCEVTGAHSTSTASGQDGGTSRSSRDSDDVLPCASLTEESVIGCYRPWPVVQRHFRQIPRRFKDYIRLPKPNAYQVAHTA